MNEALVIKYNYSDDDGGLDLGLLGESFVGVNRLLKELCELTGIQGDIDVKTTRITQGSIELHNCIQLTVTSFPFSSPQDLYEFLRIANPEMLRVAQEFFSGALGVHRTLNDYAAQYPIDAALLLQLATNFVVNAIKWTPKQKVRPTTRDAELGEISPRQAGRLRNMVLRGRYRRVLKPMTQGNVTSIKVVNVTSANGAANSIGEHDIENYLPEDDRILPDFTNGSIHQMTGELVVLQGSRGEIMKIKVDGLPRRYRLITAKPHDGQTTSDYIDFYKQQVGFTAEVVRASMYKRPEFVVLDMALNQQELVHEEQ
jgi:hypothetical protein